MRGGSDGFIFFFLLRIRLQGVESKYHAWKEKRRQEEEDEEDGEINGGG